MTDLKQRVETLTRHLEPFAHKNGYKFAKDALSAIKELTAREEKLVEAVRQVLDAIDILVLEKAANIQGDQSVRAMAELFELTDSTGKKVHQLIADRYYLAEKTLEELGIQVSK